MRDLPHSYVVGAEGAVGFQGDNLPPLVSAPPAEFGGPGNHWSPEHLLEKAEAGCLVTNSMEASCHLETTIVIGP